MKKHVITLFVMSLLGVALPAAAEEAGELSQEQQAQFDALVDEAVGHYGARRYEQAIELFERAFAILQEPELVYNIARSHERLAHREQAVEWYERFLEMPGTTGELRTRALTNISSLRQEIAAMEAAEQAAQGGGGGGGGGGQEPGPGAEPDEPMSALGIAGWALVGVGGAALITGGIFGGMALAARNNYNDAEWDQSRLDYRDDLERNALIFDIVFFSGAGLAAAGIALLVVNYMRGRSDAEDGEETDAGEEVSFVPSLVVGDGNVAFGLSGRF